MCAALTRSLPTCSLTPKQEIYGDFCVTILKESDEGSFVHRKFKLQVGNEEVGPPYIPPAYTHTHTHTLTHTRTLPFSPIQPRDIDHIHFVLWPDHDAPQTPDDVLNTHRAYRDALKRAPFPTAPSVVHCSAGVGRSGAFITLDRFYDAACAAKDKDLSLVAIVRGLREARNYMVQSLSQYMFVFSAATQMLQRLIMASLPPPKRPRTLEEVGTLSLLAEDDGDMVSECECVVDSG